MKAVPIYKVDVDRVVELVKDRVGADRVVALAEGEVGVVEEISPAPDPVATAFAQSVVIKSRMWLVSAAMTKPVLNAAPG